MEAALGRAFLKRTARGALLPATVTTLMAACRDEDRASPLGPGFGRVHGMAGHGDGGYGPLENDRGILLLPRGFEVRSLGGIGDPMSDGRPTPIALDGMACFAHSADPGRWGRTGPRLAVRAGA